MAPWKLIVKAYLGVVGAHPGPMEAHYGAMKTNHGALEAHHSAPWAPFTVAILTDFSSQTLLSQKIK
jgi:hypothetical protein